MANTITIINQYGKATMAYHAENIYSVPGNKFGETNILYNITTVGSATAVELKFYVKFYGVDTLFLLQERLTLIENVEYSLKIDEGVNKIANIPHPKSAEKVYFEIVSDADISISIGAIPNQ